MSTEGWSAAEGDDQQKWTMEYLKKVYGDKYAAARRTIAKEAKDLDEEFRLLDQLGLM